MIKLKKSSLRRLQANPLIMSQINSLAIRKGWK